MDRTLEMLDDVEEDLIARSFLYKHPASFQDGVAASLESVRAMLARLRLAAVAKGADHDATR